MALPELAPMLATPAEPTAIADPAAWRYEVKWDGYRALARVEAGELRLVSRGRLNLAPAYPELGELVAAVGGADAVLDGEIVVLDDAGRSDFHLLQTHGQRGGRPAHYMAFDLLHLGDLPVVGLGYLERRALLEDLVAESDHVHVPTTFGDDLAGALELSRGAGLEGIVAKRATSAYAPGRRSPDWLKIKHVAMQDVVVVGWTPGAGRRGSTLGGLLLAVVGPDGLVYAGRAGSGLTEADLAAAMARLAPLATDTPPLARVPRADARDARWVRPELVAQVRYSEWTPTGRLRHPVWRGWRDDVDPATVRREDPPGR